MTTCGTCGKSVDKVEHKDAHDPKQCIDCKQVLPVWQFPEHPSAGDGRRRSCDECSGTARAEQAAGRRAQKERDRQERNRRLREHGYRWHRRPSPPGRSPDWELRDPSGAPIALDEALDRIGKLEHSRGPLEDGWPVAPLLPSISVPGLRFTAIDFETANGSRASVCSVGLAKVVDGRIVDTFSSLVRPPAPHDEFSPYNVKIHGITAADVANAPNWDVIYGKVRQFTGSDPLVAHNADFDQEVLAKASAACGISVASSHWMCTLAAARAMLTLESYKLPTVSAALGLPPHAHHDAAADAQQCARVLVALYAKAGADGQSMLRQHTRRR